MGKLIPLQKLTERLFTAFESTLEELRYSVTLHPHFSVVCSGIVEDGPMYSCLGLSCERVDDEMPEVSLSFSCVLLRPNETVDATLNCSVGWHRGASLGGLDGFSIYEAMAPLIHVGGMSDLSSASEHIPALRSAFLKALTRGTLPSRRQQLWNRLFHGCPEPWHFSLNNQ